MKRVIIYLIPFFISSLSVSKAQDNSKPLTIDLKDFKIAFTSIMIDPYYNLFFKVSNDTTFVSLELGDTPEGETFKVISPNIKQITVYQKYETSVSIENEGPHLDLLDWKHYNSDWKELKNISNQQFQSAGYTEEEHHYFTKVTLKEFKDAVIKYGGTDWNELISNVKSVNDNPCFVDINKIIYKFDYNVKGEHKIKYLVFDIPMGD